MIDPFHRIFDVGVGILILLGLYSIFFPVSLVSKTTQIGVLLTATAALAVASFNSVGLYKQWAGSDLISECNRVFAAVLLVFSGLLLFGYAFKVSSIYSRRVILAAMTGL
jgi:putative colanic acid biosynthesis UDP-glucose lipid carrier transferase